MAAIESLRAEVELVVWLARDIDAGVPVETSRITTRLGHIRAILDKTLHSRLAKVFSHACFAEGGPTRSMDAIRNISNPAVKDRVYEDLQDMEDVLTGTAADKQRAILNLSVRFVHRAESWLADIED